MLRLCPCTRAVSKGESWKGERLCSDAPVHYRARIKQEESVINRVRRIGTIPKFTSHRCRAAADFFRRSPPSLEDVYWSNKRVERASQRSRIS